MRRPRKKLFPLRLCTGFCGRRCFGLLSARGFDLAIALCAQVRLVDLIIRVTFSGLLALPLLLILDDAPSADFGGL